VETKPVEKKEEPVGSNSQGGQQSQSTPPIESTTQSKINPTNYEIPQAEKEKMIEELMLMGFDRPLIEKCLAASFYNKERAIEYLVSVSL